MKKRLLLIISIISLSVGAQNSQELDYSQSTTYEIGGIILDGAKNLNDNALISISGLSVGETIEIPGGKITSAIQNLWKQGLFSDVDISIEKIIEKTIFLKIKVVEYPRLSKFKFKGRKVSKSEISSLKEN